MFGISKKRQTQFLIPPYRHATGATGSLKSLWDANVNEISSKEKHRENLKIENSLCNELCSFNTFAGFISYVATELNKQFYINKITYCSCLLNDFPMILLSVFESL